MEPEEQARKLLKAKGLRVTGTRLALVSALMRAPEPASLETAHKLCGHFGGDQATVYRNLQALTAAGVLRAVKGVGRREMFELAAHRHGHAHLACTKCGRVECMEMNDLPARPARPAGWSISDVSVTVWGLCPACR
ncbi:MAG: transcriptional repressor [Planctomycetes bacterium]|jgi:Fe2+ or Zn2+ uptake regulation protein|nr:transcriptional repressor [Planctomycetota bacterium]MCL4731374.1 transcriptional repressor [Planctomycetota bacterium]